VKSLHENSRAFVWEESGLFEGDILVLDPDRNVVLDKSARWANATIPFFIEESHFSDEEIKTILLGVYEFNTKTCLRLRPFEKSDENWVTVTGNEGGCWSSVGMKNEGGQQLNLHSPNCVQKGVVQHEFLHAAGFYHQQSSANRDDFVTILWENIDESHASNFKKYNSSIVTDFNYEYDYNSIMHYSSKAFSKNGKETIVAKNNSVTHLGQRKGFTEIDIKKLNRLYDTCHKSVTDDSFDEFDIIMWFKSLF
jgi:Astacin (Peptidase family M12A)